MYLRFLRLFCTTRQTSKLKRLSNLNKKCHIVIGNRPTWYLFIAAAMAAQLRRSMNIDVAFLPEEFRIVKLLIASEKVLGSAANTGTFPCARIGSKRNAGFNTEIQEGVLNVVEESPNVSMRRTATQFQIAHTSTWRFLKDMGFRYFISNLFKILICNCNFVIDYVKI